MNESFARALATLDRGAHFFGAGLRDVQGAVTLATPLAISWPCRAKVIGNGLRELDRFLNLLIDEALYAQTQVAFPGQRNTANKLRAFHNVHGLPDVHGPRLHALGRSRECLFHCEGRVRRGDKSGELFMTAGWPEVPGARAPLCRFPVGENMIINPADLADIGAFYRYLAGEIEALAAFPDARPHRSGTVANGSYCKSAP